MRKLAITMMLGGILAVWGCNQSGGNKPAQQQASAAPTAEEMQQAAPADESIPYRVPKPTIVSATEWGSQPDTDALKPHTPKFITIHHAGETWKAGSDPVAKLKALQSWGKAERGWPDVPYHFLIAPDGRTYEGRQMMYAPDTNTNYDVTGHIGIEVWGNYEEVRITREALVALVDLIAWVCQEYQVDPDTIAGHRDRPGANTVCPGKDFYRYVQQGLIKDWVRAKIAGEEPEITLLPDPEGGPTEFIQP